MTDWQKEHSVWVSSLSAGKTWEIDSRMPCRAVNSFSLAATYDDDRYLLPAVGLFGGGSILTQPVVARYDMRTELIRPVLTVDKSPGATGLHMFQRPEFRPRFQTNSLECFACPGLSSHVYEPEVSVARTSTFALPDVSEGVFTCGLTSFRTCASEFLAPGAVESLGYGDDTGTMHFWSAKLMKKANRKHFLVYRWGARRSVFLQQKIHPTKVRESYRPIRE